MLGHDNIFALGDVADLPVQRSMIGNMHQIRCVRQNALNYLSAKTLTGTYKLESSIPLVTGVATLSSYWSKEGAESLSAENLVKDTLNYYLKCKFGSAGATKIYKGKSDGVGKIYSTMNKFQSGKPTGADPRFVMDH